MTHSVVDHTATPGGSTFVNGQFPKRPWLVVLLSALAGLGLTAIWSAHFVDSTIGDSIADTLLGHDANATPIAGVAAGMAFAFASGVAGTFTACNIAVFGAVSPMLDASGRRWRGVTAILRPIGWMSAGMLVVSATYGVIVGIVGTHLPQFATAASAPGTLSARSIQSMIVFGLIGLAMTYLGLASLGLVRDPFRRIVRRFPNASMMFMGALVGGFLVGRPFGLFRQMFRDAAESHNPWYGAAAFALQSVGNIVVMVVLFTLVVLLAGNRLQRWLTANPSRITVITAASLLIAGVFTLLYWDVRLLERRGIIPWYPTAPWA